MSALPNQPPPPSPWSQPLRLAEPPPPAPSQANDAAEALGLTGSFVDKLAQEARFFNTPGATGPQGDEYAVVRPDLEEKRWDVSFMPDGSVVRKERPIQEIEAERARRVFGRAREISNASVDTYQTERIFQGWRIAREIARLLGQVNDQQTLDEAIPELKGSGAQTEDPWIKPHRYEWPGDEVECRTHWTEAVEIIKAAEALEDPYQHHSLVYEPDPDNRDGWLVKDRKGRWEASYGMTILPPLIPLAFYNDGQILPTYMPEVDKKLVLYVELVNAVAKRLSIRVGSQHDPTLGEKGLMGITDVRTVRLLFPTRYEIVAMENKILQDAIDLLTSLGPQGARDSLWKQYGFINREITVLLKLALLSIRKQTIDDIDSMRALMISRLDKVANKAREALDLRNELAALKQASIVAKLQDGNITGDQFTGMLEVIREVTRAKRGQGPLPPGERPRKLVQNTAGGPAANDVIEVPLELPKGT